MWFEGGETLQNARRLVCMGYSLPESDLTMKHFLRTARAGEICIQILEPSDDALANFKRLLRGTHAKVQQPFSGPECICEFVAALPKQAKA